MTKLVFHKAKTTVKGRVAPDATGRRGALMGNLLDARHAPISRFFSSDPFVFRAGLVAPSASQFFA